MFKVFQIITGLVVAVCLGYCVYEFMGLMPERFIAADTGWILGTGHYILQNGFIPNELILSTGESHGNIIYYQWLFMVLLAFVEEVSSREIMLKVFLFFVPLIFLILPFIFLRKNKVFLPISLFIMFTLFIVVLGFNELRPGLMSSFFLILQYLLVQKFRSREICFYLLLFYIALIYVVWANMHLGVVLGLLFLVFFWLGDLFDFVRRKRLPRKFLNYQYIAIILFALGASLLNVYGVGIYEHLHYITTVQSEFNSHIVELQSNNYWALFPLLFLLPVFFVRRFWVRINTSDILILIFLSFLGFYSFRFCVWLILFSMLIIPRILNIFISYLPAKLVSEVFLLRSLNNYVLVGLLVGAVAFSGFRDLPIVANYGKCASYIPGIKKYQELNMSSTNVFHDELIGSCINLYDSGEKVSLNTQFDLYSNEFLLNTLNNSPQKTKLFLENNAFESIFISTGSVWLMPDIIREDEDYVLAYQDNYSLIFLRLQ